MPDLVHRRRLFAWIAIVPVAGLLSACQTPSAPKKGAAADKEAESYEEVRGDGTGGMGNY